MSIPLSSEGDSPLDTISMENFVSREEFNNVVKQLNFALTLIAENHNGLCDTIGEKAFEVDIPKELEQRRVQTTLNGLTSNVNKIKKETEKEIEKVITS